MACQGLNMQFNANAITDLKAEVTSTFIKAMVRLGRISKEKEKEKEKEGKKGEFHPRSNKLTLSPSVCIMMYYDGACPTSRAVFDFQCSNTGT